jgi:hypothetical protein
MRGILYILGERGEGKVSCGAQGAGAGRGCCNAQGTAGQGQVGMGGETLWWGEGSKRGRVYFSGGRQQRPGGDDRTVIGVDLVTRKCENAQNTFKRPCDEGWTHITDARTHMQGGR